MNNKKKLGITVAVISVVFIVAVLLMVRTMASNHSEELEKESQKLSVSAIETKSGELIETEYTCFDENEFYIKVPTSFKQLDYETILQKYNGDVPDIVFSNEQTTVNVAVSLTDNEMKDSGIGPYKSYIENLLEDSSEIIASDDYEVDGNHIGHIKVLTKAADTDVYNNMIFFSYNDKLVIITFNCTAQLKEEWEQVGDFIIESLFFNES